MKEKLLKLGEAIKVRLQKLLPHKKVSKLDILAGQYDSLRACVEKMEKDMAEALKKNPMRSRGRYTN